MEKKFKILLPEPENQEESTAVLLARHLSPKLLVLVRDDFRCRVCNYKPRRYFPKRLCVHHLDENRKNNQLDNLITLCSYCHAFIHGRAFIF